MPDGASEISIVYGTPKSDDSTTSYSDHQFNIYLQSSTGSVSGQTIAGETETYDLKVSSAANGFRWKAPDPFELVISNTSGNNTVYQYNIAEYNTEIFGTSNTYFIDGYQDLGSVSLVNNNATAMDDGYSIVIEYDIDASGGDVVKEIYFPYDPTNGISSIANIKYELSNGAKYDISDISALSYELAHEYSATNTILIEAPEDETITSAEITLSSWGTQNGVATAGIRGYLKNSSELDDGDVADAHKITVTIYDDEGNVATDNSADELKTGTSVNTKFIAPTSAYANFNIDGLSTYQNGNEYVNANVLTPGLATTINFQLFGGAFRTTSTSLWREIVFGIVIPNDLTLDAVTVGDFTLTYNGNTYTGDTTDEKVGGIEEVGNGTAMTQAQINAHFGEESSVTSATIHTFKISDPDTVLYGYSKDGNTRNYFSSFTVSATITPSTTASNAIYSWDKLVAVGSNADYDTFGLLALTGTWTYATTPGTAQAIANMSEGSGLKIGSTNTIVVGSSDEYLAIKSNPALMLHDAHVSYDDDDYYYNEYDSSTVPVLSSGDTGDIVFSVTNTIPTESKKEDETLLVYYALPTVESTASSLVDSADFAVTIDSANITVKDENGKDIIYNSVTNSSTDSQYVSLYYLNMDGSLGITADTTVDDLYGKISTTYTAGTHNTLVIAIKNMDQTNTFEVTIPFTAPNYEANDELYVKFAGQASFYLGNSQVMFYGGYQSGTTLMANNYVSFAYAYPTWDVTITGVATDEDGKVMGTVEIPSEYTTAHEISDGEEVTVASTYDILGYDFVGYYSNPGVTNAFTFDDGETDTFTVTEDTTLYAKFETKKLNTVYWDYNYPSDYDETEELTDVTYDDVYWTDTIVFPETPADTTKYTFTGAQYTIVVSDASSYTAGGNYTIGTDEYVIHEVINNTESPDYIVLEEDIVAGTYLHVADLTVYDDNGEQAITIMGSWTKETTYTVTYDVDGGTPAIDTVDHYVSGHSVPISDATPTKSGYTFGGWKASTDDTTYNYGDHYTMTAQDVVFTAIWSNASYDITYKVNGTTVETANTEYGTTVSFRDGSTYAPTGYTFESWEYNHTYYTKDSTDFTMPAYAITVTAVLSPISYKVTYDTDGGTTVDEKTVEYGDIVTLPTVTKDGYTFVKWTSDDVTISHNSFNMPAGDVTVTANWTANGYTVTYADTGDSTIDSYTIGSDTVITLPDAPTKAGYTFDGWLSSSDSTTYAAGADFTMPAYNVTMTAQWTQTGEYIVTYEYGINDSDSDFKTDSYNAGVNVTITNAVPTYDGYDFEEWYYNGAYYNANDTTIIMPAENITITATWTAKEYTLSYANHDSSDTAYDNATVTFGTDATLASAPTKAGYTFLGWSDDNVYTTYYTAGSSYTMPAYNVTMTAVWSLNTGYTITYEYGLDTNDTTFATANYNAGVTVTITDAEPTREGYTFAGWTSTDVTITNNQFVMPDNAVTIDATWIIISYTLSFADTGDNAIVDVTLNYAEDYTLTAPTKTGYTFVSWLYDGTEYKENVNFDFTMPAKDVTLTAQWSAVSYTLSFDEDGGSVIPDVSLGYQGTYTLPTSVKTGYTLLGWSEDNDDTTYTAAGETFTMPAYAVSLKAVWDADDYKVTFEPNNGTASFEYTVDYDTVVTEPTDPTLTGYTFAGWHVNSYLDEEFDFTYTIKVDTTLYAAYTPKTIAVTWNANGGEIDDDETNVLWNDTISATQIPTRYGYTFIGWYTDSSTINRVIDSSIYGDSMTGDTVLELTLYAGWTKDPTYTVTYVHDGDSEEITVTGEYIEGAPVTITTAIPTKTGYTFESWQSNYTVSADTKVYYVGDEIFTMPTEDVTFTATWTINEYTVTLNTDDDNASTSTQTVDYLEKIVEPKDPTKTGYTFAGWYVGDVEFNFDSEITADVVVTAKWTVNSYTLSFADTGDTEIASEVLDFGTDTTLQTPTKVGYTVLHWTDGTTEYPANSTYTMPAGDTTLTAIWSGNSYTVSYALNEGTGTVPTTASYVIGSDVTVYDVAPTRSGYTFKGWVSSVDGKTYALGSTYVMTASNVTFTASWSSNSTAGSSGGGVSTGTTTDTSTAELNRDDHFAYMNGYTDGTFAPNQNITRAETIVMFSRLLTDTMDTTATYANSFSDVTSDLWYANAVGFMEQYGIINGYTDGTFGGGNYITRAEFATIASRFDELTSSGANNFTDVADSHWAIDYIISASAKGWITGYTDGTFAPDQNITRAEAVTLVNRVLVRVCDEDFTQENLDEMVTFSDVLASHWAYYQIIEATNSHEYSVTDDVETWTSLS